MKIQLLPSSFGSKGQFSPEQRLTCFLIDDRVAIDGGSIGISVSDQQRNEVRDIIITHPHIDHVASLPIFIDDLFSTLNQPVRIYATQEVIDILERDLFNWALYPRFSELNNDHGRVLKYIPIVPGKEFEIAHLRVTAIPVNHRVPTVGLIVSDGLVTVAFSSDTAQTQDFWTAVNSRERLDALFIESSFPDSMAQLAEDSFHLTPATLKQELSKLDRSVDRILAVHLKPSFRETLISQLESLKIENLEVMEPGRAYEFRQS